MPRSKVNKDRKEKLTNFKNQQKTKKMPENTTNELPFDFKPFKQIPIWEPDAKIEVTGAEFMAFQNFFNIFAEPIQHMQTIFKRNMDSGVITIKYEGEDGTEISKETIEKQMLQLQEFYAQKAQEVTPENANPEAEAEPLK